MIGLRALQHHLMAAAVVGAGLIIAAPADSPQAPLPVLHVSAIDLTAAEGVAPTAGDALDGSWLGQAVNNIDTYSANFLNTMHETMATETTALNSIYSDWLADSGTGINSAIQNLDALGQDYGHWAEGFFQSVVALETEMPGTVTADNTTLCDVFTLIGMDMDKWANAMGMGLGDTFQNAVTEFSTLDQQMMDGLNAMFSGL